MRVYDLGADIMSVGKPLKVAESPGFTEGVMLNNRRMVDGHFLSYISYSTGRWNTEHYNIRYATATSPLGPWTYRGVIMRKGRLQRPDITVSSTIPRPGDGSRSIIDGNSRQGAGRWESVRSPWLPFGSTPTER